MISVEEYRKLKQRARRSIPAGTLSESDLATFERAKIPAGYEALGAVPD